MPHLTCRLAAVAWVAASLCIEGAVAPDWCFLWVLWHKAAQPHARPIRLTAVAHKHEVRQAVFPKETAILLVEIHRVHARWLLLQPTIIDRFALQIKATWGIAKAGAGFATLR